MRPVQEITMKHAALASDLPLSTFFIFYLFHSDAPQIFMMEFPTKAWDQKSQMSSRLFILLQDSPRKRYAGLWRFPGVWTERRGRFLCSSNTLTPPPFFLLLFFLLRQIKLKQDFHNKNVCTWCGQDDFRCYSWCLIMTHGQDIM